MQEIQVQSLGWDDPLEEEMATHSSILAWRVPWTEEPGGLRSIRSQRIRYNRSNLSHTHIYRIDKQQDPTMQHYIQYAKIKCNGKEYLENAEMNTGNCAPHSFLVR